MTLIEKLLGLLRRTPRTSEEIEAELESQRLRDDLETLRLSQRSTAGENYQSGGGIRP